MDFELAHFEADHARDPGADPQTAVTLATSALAQRPTVFAEDTMGWSLRQAGRPADALPHALAAVRLGTADALLWFHLAATEADLGQLDNARAHLSRVLTINPAVVWRDPRGEAGTATHGVAGKSVRQALWLASRCVPSPDQNLRL